jgi:hypothetical protein
MERVGEHAEAVWKSVNLSPESARRLMFGVAISPPNAAVSVNPRSSATIMMKFGFLELVIGDSVGGGGIWYLMHLFREEFPIVFGFQVERNRLLLYSRVK